MREKESVFRTKRAKRCRRVLLQRSSTRCLTCFLPHCCMLLLWNDCLIGSPKIGVAMSCSIRFWNGFPEHATGLFTSITYGVCHDLPRLTTQGNPDPRLVRLFQDKRAIRSSHSKPVASGSFASGVSTVVLSSGSFSAFFYPSDD